MLFEVRVEVMFGHHVVEPHFHGDAHVVVELSSHVALEAGSGQSMLGVDVATFRAHLEAGLSERICGRLLVWDRELDEAASMEVVPADKGVVVPQLVVTPWPVRPTIETVTLVVAALVQECARACDGPVARVESVCVFESRRSAGCLRGGAIDTALAEARAAFGGTLFGTGPTGAVPTADGGPGVNR